MNTGMGPVLRILSGSLAAVLCLHVTNAPVAAFSSKDFFLFNLASGFGGDDHNKLSVSAVGNVGGSYPDIQKFSQVIIESASNEGISGLGAHDDPEGQNSFWFGNETLWREDLDAKYAAMEYEQAYARLGFLLHMRQDFFVPAHQKINNHGLPLSYTISPNNPTQVTGDSHSDQFEKFASNNHVSSVPPDINFDITLLDPKTGCDSKFWLSDSEDGDSSSGSLGAYGRQQGVPCASPFLSPTTADGDDWFADPDFAITLEPLAQRIAHAQLYLARQESESELKGRSEAMEPLFTQDLAIEGGPLGGSNVATLSFSVTENRLQNVNVDVFIQGTGQKIVSQETELKLTSFRSETGVGEFTTLPGPITWNNRTTPLFKTNATDLALLPFEAEFRIKWDGEVVGEPLPEGEHTVCVVAKDGDVNPSQDTCVSFPAEGPQILDEELPGAVFNDGSFKCLKFGLLKTGISDARARRTAWPSVAVLRDRPASDASRPFGPRLRFSLSAFFAYGDARARRTGWRPVGATHDRPALDAGNSSEARPTPAPFARPGLSRGQLVSGRLGRWPSLRGTAMPAAPHVAGRSFDVQPCPLARRRLGIPLRHGFVFDLSAFSINGHGPAPAVVMPGVGGCAAVAGHAAGWLSRVQRRPAGGGLSLWAVAAVGTEDDGHGLHTPPFQRRAAEGGAEEALQIARDFSTLSTKFTARRRRGGSLDV